MIISTDVPSVFLDNKLFIKRFTPAAKKLFNVFPSDVGRPLADLTTQFDDLDLVEDAKNVLASLTPIAREIKTAAGEWYNCRILIYRTVDNRVEGVVVTFADITEQKKTEAALRETAKRDASLIANSPDAILVFRDDRITLVNQACLLLFGAERPEDLLAKSPSDLLHPDFRAAVGNGMRQLVEHAKPVPPIEEKIVRLDGRLVDVEATSSLFSDDGADAVHLVLRDATKRKQREITLIERQRRSSEQLQELEAIYNSAPQGLCLLDLDLRFLRINTALADVYGLSVAEHLGHSVGAVLPRFAPIIEPLFRRVIETGEPFDTAEIRGETPDLSGVERVWHYDGYPLKDEEGSVRAVAVIVREVTDLIRANEELRFGKEVAEQADRAKTQLLNAVSHDLRQPLQALGMFVRSLAPKVGDGRAGDILEGIERSLESVEDLLASLMDVARLEARSIKPDFEDFHLGPVLERLCTEISWSPAAKEIDVRLVNTSLKVHSDPVVLTSILRNLFLNALSRTKRGRVLVGCRRRHGRARVEVWDTGVEIPADEPCDIFEEFLQPETSPRLRANPPGLGLSIVRRKAQLLDHPVDAGSLTGKGSRFAIEIPLSSAEPTSSP